MASDRILDNVGEPMSTGHSTATQLDDPGQLRDDWLRQLSDLTSAVKSWAEELDWSTRQIGKSMKDSRLGPYEAPALVMQKDTVRVLLDPVARFAPGTDGIVDLYLMPAYDDIAGLYRVAGEWRVHYVFPTSLAVAKLGETESSPLTKEVLQRVLDSLISHAA